MKYLLFVVLIGLQGIGASHALAWSPMPLLQANIESWSACQRLVASSDQDQEQQQSDEQHQGEGGEDDEPDCD